MNFFFFNDTATTEIYTLSLHDALPISVPQGARRGHRAAAAAAAELVELPHGRRGAVDLFHDREQERSEEHTSELQSQSNLVCRLLLAKKKGADVHGSYINSIGMLAAVF